jgi:hypothetical protein
VEEIVKINESIQQTAANANAAVATATTTKVLPLQ